MSKDGKVDYDPFFLDSKSVYLAGSWHDLVVYRRSPYLNTNKNLRTLFFTIVFRSLFSSCRWYFLTVPFGQILVNSRDGYKYLRIKIKVNCRCEDNHEFLGLYYEIIVDIVFLLMIISCSETSNNFKTMDLCNPFLSCFQTEKSLIISL